jgi:hypothetical protein
MGCGCGKARVAKPMGATPTVSRATSQSTQAKVIGTSSPYTMQQNVAPAHLQKTISRRVV